MENERQNLELKHLGFVRIAVIQTIVCVTNLYDYAKQNSGPLRSAVESVESAVNTVVAPAYEKLRIAPDDVLVFLDEKVFFVFFNRLDSLDDFLGSVCILIFRLFSAIQSIVGRRSFWLVID